MRLVRSCVGCGVGTCQADLAQRLIRPVGGKTKGGCVLCGQGGVKALDHIWREDCLSAAELFAFGQLGLNHMRDERCDPPRCVDDVGIPTELVCRGERSPRVEEGTSWIVLEDRTILSESMEALSLEEVDRVHEVHLQAYSRNGGHLDLQGIAQLSDGDYRPGEPNDLVKAVFPLGYDAVPGHHNARLHTLCLLNGLGEDAQQLGGFGDF